MNIFDHEYRVELRKKLVNYLISYLDTTRPNNKVLAFVIKAFHFMIPWITFYFFLFGSYCIFITCYVVLLFFVVLYIYLNGCFISHLEYKLYSKNFVNIIDPYLIILRQDLNKTTRFYGTFLIAFIYFIIISLIFYFRFLKKIE